MTHKAGSYFAAAALRAAQAELDARESVRKAVAASKKSYPNRYVCPNCGCYPIDRPGTLEREIKHALNSAMNEQKGKPVSDADRSYRRGWRDCIRALRDYFKDALTIPES